MKLTTKQIDEKIRKYRELEKIIISMKSIASANVKRAQNLIESLREYETNLIDSISTLLSYFPNLTIEKVEGKSLVVVYGSDLGLCGVFNEKVSKKAQDVFGKSENLLGYLIVGKKLADIMDSKVLKVFSAPTHYEAIYARASELIDEISKLFRENISEIYTVFNEFLGIGSYRPTVRRIFPFEVKREKVSEFSPIVDIPPQEILIGLIVDYIFARIYRAYLESFLSENGVRLMNMNNASSSIERNLEKLKLERNYYRQEEITAEIEEIMSAYKVIAGE